MRQAYIHVIQACEQALADYDKTQELLEYPEVQADKGYYLSLLKKFNELERLNTRQRQLKNCIAEEEKLVQVLSTLNSDEKALAIEEIAMLRKEAMAIVDVLAEVLGCGGGDETVFCRILVTDGATQLCEKLVELLIADLTSHGITVNNVNVQRKKGVSSETTFNASGRNALARLGVLSGIHKVLNTSDEIVLAATPAASVFTLDERDVKIDLFHSSGAGGQNINKVETAVRATHIPTGTVVTCQDERSQLNNKRRAIENLAKRLADTNAELEKKRMDADVKTQLKRVSVLCLSANCEFVDKVNGIEGPLNIHNLTNYINAILAKGN